MAHQGLNDLLLHQVHRKRIPERLRRHRPDGKRHTVTRTRRHSLTYPTARRVFTPYIPEPAACRQLRGRKPLPEPLNESRIGQRHRPRRVVPDLSLGFPLRQLLFLRRSPAPAVRLRAAFSSFRCLSVRSTTNGEESGAPVSGSSSTKSTAVSGRILFSRPPVFHRVSIRGVFSGRGLLTAAQPPQGRAGSGAFRCRRRRPSCAAPRRFRSQSSAQHLKWSDNDQWSRCVKSASVSGVKCPNFQSPLSGVVAPIFPCRSSENHGNKSIRRGSVSDRFSGFFPV